MLLKPFLSCAGEFSFKSFKNVLFLSPAMCQGLVLALILSVTDTANGQLLTSTLDDFESGADQNKFLAYWYFYDDIKDGGNSKVLNAEVRANGQLGFKGAYGNGRPPSQHAAVVDYIYGDKKPKCGEDCTFGQFVGIGTGLHPAVDDSAVLDISTATKLTMWMRAVPDMTVRVEIATADVKDFGFFRSVFDVSAEWAEYTIDFYDRLSFAQPTWADVVDKFAKDSTQKVQWQISGDYPTNPPAGKLFIDDVVIHDYIWEPPTKCRVIGAAGAGQGVEFSFFDSKPFDQNKVGGFWYAYNDAPGRNVTLGEFSEIFGGVKKDPLDPKLVNLFINGNGMDSTNAAFIEFELGPTYVENGETIMPFAGIGTSTANSLGTMAADFKSKGVTAVTFDYKSNGDFDYLRFEVKAHQGYSDPGIVHHCLAPNSKGQWKNVEVDLNTSLFLPSWEKVFAMPEAMRKLNTSYIKGLQWAVHSAPKTKGSIAVDNVKLVGPPGMIIDSSWMVNTRRPIPKKKAGFKLNSDNRILNIFNIASHLRHVELVNLNGEVIAKPIIKSGRASLELQGIPRGIYFVKLHGLYGRRPVSQQRMFTRL